MRGIVFFFKIITRKSRREKFRGVIFPDEPEISYKCCAIVLSKHFKTLAIVWGQLFARNMGGKRSGGNSLVIAHLTTPQISFEMIMVGQFFMTFKRGGN